MKTSRFLAIALFFTVFSAAVHSQTFDLSGKVQADSSGMVKDLIVQLLNKEDSSLAKNEFTDEQGNFLFSAVKAGEYLIQINGAGFKKYLSEPILLDRQLQLEPIKLQYSEIALQEVAVVSKKSFIEREKGKVILNVESSINAAGSSAFDIIEKAPGVRVDNTDNISLNGRPGTAVWIDGKPTPMTGSDLANYLRGIPSSAIEKIEMIPNPSARYDAAGSSIINIILKKDKKIGTNGSISLSYGQGVYPKSNNSISLNHRNKKINVYGSYSYARRQVFSRLQLQRQFYRQDTFIGAFDQDNYFKYDFNTHIARAGVDYYINKKNTLGVMVNGVNNIFNPTANNSSVVFNSSNIASSLFHTISNNSNDRSNFSANVNYKHDFDSTGSALVSDVDFARYGSSSMQNIETRYMDLNYKETQIPYLLYGDLNGMLDIFAIKNDYNKLLGKGINLEAGQKSSYVLADNQLSFFDRSNGGNLYDSTKSNHFIYTENINAAYVSMSKEFKKWSVQLGLRGEHTSVTGEQLVYKSKFSRNYGQLFPNLLLTYKLNEKNAVEFNYSRRIRRPGYDQLNPFKFYLDPTTYKEGNPFLQPSITESFELSHIFKQNIYTSLGFGRTYNNIIEVIAPLTNEQRVTVQTNRNLAQVDVFTLNGAIPTDVTKWWNTSNNFNIYYALYSGNVANTPINNRGNLTMNFSTVNTFNLPGGISAELSANYQAREVYAFDVIEPIWSINIGAQKKILNNKGVLRLNFNDVFYTNRIRAKVRFTDYNESFLVTRDTQVATLSFTYKFGKNSVPGARRRQGGAEDVKERANGMG